jgi:hypothetical protein
MTVILGLVPRIQPSTNDGASGRMDGWDKPDHDTRLALRLRQSRNGDSCRRHPHSWMRITASISTLMLPGSEPIPTAERA